MRITEVRVKLMEDPDDRLQAFCSITFDDAFVVRDLKIIEGPSGPFVAMPSRKLSAHCHKCGYKNHIRASYCNQCGNRQSQSSVSTSHEGRPKLYADIAHPINSACREMIQNAVVLAFEEEKKLASRPDYISRYDDVMDVDDPASRKSNPGSKSTETDRPKSEPDNRSKPADPLEVNRRTDKPGPSPALTTKTDRRQANEKPTAIHHNKNEFGDGIF